MRQQLLSDGAQELRYEIREIVKKAEQLRRLGCEIHWENIGDPIQKHHELPVWIREIVKKAEQLRRLGCEIHWENIGDPIQKHHELPLWIREIIAGLAMDNDTYSYCPSKGVLDTRQFLADRTNAQGGVQITADDICFFNGLGDAIAKVYQFLDQPARIIGPSPAYSTHSSAEAAHASHEPLTYRLDPDNHWYPDLDDLYNKVKYNPNVVGILIINPDNPTGMVYPPETLRRIVDIAREFRLFLIADEIYINITYNGVRAIPLAEVAGTVPAISMQGISKELPWPGARCGWVEYYNRNADPEFNRLCQAIDNAKMIEVCSTKLPQLAIPKILGDPRFASYRQETNNRIGRRSRIISGILGDLPQVTFNETNGAFYNTIIFRPGVLKPGQTMPIADDQVRRMVESFLEPGMPEDKRFVYYLLGAQGVCVVPISSFASELQGFRVTLLEEDEALLTDIFTRIRNGIVAYTQSV